MTRCPVNRRAPARSASTVRGCRFSTSEALRRLHESGCRTLAHIEPYPTPNIIHQELSALLEAIAFVDEVYFGGWNYNSVVGERAGTAAFYREQAAAVRRFCTRRGIRCETAA